MGDKLFFPIIEPIIIGRMFLWAVKICTHTAHDSEDIVVDTVDEHSGARAEGGGSISSHPEFESGVVDTREVASTGRLMFHGVEGEGVRVYTIGRGSFPVLVRLDIVEVGTISFLEAIMAVKLEKSFLEGVASTISIGRVESVITYFVTSGKVSRGNSGKGGTSGSPFRDSSTEMSRSKIVFKEDNIVERSF